MATLELQLFQVYVPNPDILFYNYLQYIFWYGNKL